MKNVETVKKEIQEIEENIINYYTLLKCNEEVSKKMKAELEKEFDKRISGKESMAEIELVVGDVTLHRSTFPHRSWTTAFREEMIQSGKIHLFCKPTDSWAERYDVSSLIIKEPSLPTLKTKLRFTKKDKEKHSDLLVGELADFEELLFEEQVERYLEIRDDLDYFTKSFEADKAKILQLMIDNKINTTDVFELKAAPVQYDWSKLYQLDELVETVKIAYDGNTNKSIDLFTGELVNIVPKDLINPQYFDEKLSKKMRDKLVAEIGENYFLVTGTRIEKDVFKRLDILSSGVDDAIDNGLLPNSLKYNNKYHPKVEGRLFTKFEILPTEKYEYIKAMLQEKENARNEKEQQIEQQLTLSI